MHEGGALPGREWWNSARARFVLYLGTAETDRCQSCARVLEPKQLHPTSDWIVQQLREAFPLPCPSRYVLFDHDAKFGNEVLTFLKSSDLKPMRRAFAVLGRTASPNDGWAARAANCWITSFRCMSIICGGLGGIILAINHDNRTHTDLNKGTPANRAMEQRSIRSTHISSAPRIGGLHHRVQLVRSSLSTFPTRQTRTTSSAAVDSAVQTQIARTAQDKSQLPV
jgi:hypothetical protein